MLIRYRRPRALYRARREHTPITRVANLRCHAHHVGGGAGLTAARSTYLVQWPRTQRGEIPIAAAVVIHGAKTESRIPTHPVRCLVLVSIGEGAGAVG